MAEFKGLEANPLPLSSRIISRTSHHHHTLSTNSHFNILPTCPQRIFQCLIYIHFALEYPFRLGQHLTAQALVAFFMRAADTEYVPHPEELPLDKPCQTVERLTETIPPTFIEARLSCPASNITGMRPSADSC